MLLDSPCTRTKKEAYNQLVHPKRKNIGLVPLRFFSIPLSIRRAGDQHVRQHKNYDSEVILL
jgi:hypothetical protein